MTSMGPILLARSIGRAAHGQTSAQTPAAPAAPRQSDAELGAQIRRDAAEIRRQALENARSQLEAVRAQQLQQQQEQQQQRGVLVTPPAPPAIPRITITRDGQAPIIVAGGGGTPVTTTSTGIPPILFRPDVPPGAVTMAIAFFLMLAFIAVGLPLARAWARRMDRQSLAPAAPFPSDVTDRLERIEHAVESIAIEVERVSEGQRFTTKLLAEQRPELGAAVPVARPDQYAGGGR